MNRVLAFTIEQMMAPCRVYAADFPGGIPPGKDGRGANKIKAVARAKINPSSAAHAAAHAAKAKTYTEEKPCKKCHGFLRYTAGRQCVVCHREAARVSAQRCYLSKSDGLAGANRALREKDRQARDAAGDQMFYNSPGRCGHCGTCERYTRSGKCKRCTQEARNRLRAKPGGY